MVLNDFKFDVFHNKSQTLRIYFSHVNINENNDICIGAIWNADRSFHSKNEIPNFLQVFFGSSGKSIPSLMTRFNF